MLWSLPLLFGLFFLPKTSECEGESPEPLVEDMQDYPFKLDVEKHLSGVTKLDGEGHLPIEFF